MTEVKKDHAIGSGSGAVAGAASGALIGAAGGPIGASIGAIIGAIGGANAGDAVAEYVNPTEYDDYWRDNYTSKEYYNKTSDWDDYAPAYGLGYHAKGANAGRKYDEAENDLEQKWDEVKGDSKLAWNDARGAVRDGWHHVERALPGDFDGDGR